MLAFLAIAVLLMLLDRYTPVLKPVRNLLGSALTPLYQLADLPSDVAHWVDNSVTSRAELQRENEALKAQLLVYQRKLQKFASLSAENVRMRELLSSSERLDEKVLISEISGVPPDPYAHKVLIDKGAMDGVREGLPVLDAYGLVGQVTEVNALSSQVLLITDVTHALPLQVNRNGVRVIAEGTGDLGTLRLRYVSSTTDIKEGDLLVSSGLGGRFPMGYPVGTVTSVVIDPGRPFAEVLAAPSAHLDRSRYLLVVLSGNGQNNAE